MIASFKTWLKNLAPWLKSPAGVAVLMALLTVAILSPVLIFQTTTLFINQDNVNQFYSWYQKLATSWHEGYLPLWNSDMYSGWSFAAELQPGILYPINWLWVALFGSVQGISEYALNWLMALHFWIAAFGAYLFIKELKAERWAAFVAAATFAFSGAVAIRSFSQSVIFFGLAILPWVLYTYAKFIKTRKQKWLLASGALWGLTFVVGHIQPFFHIALTVIVLELVGLYKSWQGFSKLWQAVVGLAKRLVVFGLAALVIMLPQLIVSAPYINDNYRVQANGLLSSDVKIDYGYFAKPFNVDMHEFANLIEPFSYPIRDTNDFYIGLVAVVVITAVLFVCRQQLKNTAIWATHKSFITVLLVLSVVAMLGYVTWFAVVLYELPFVYQVRQLGRYAVLFDLGLILVLTAALQAAVVAKLTKKQKIILGAVGAFLLINAVYVLALRQYIFNVHFALSLGLSGLAIMTIVLAKQQKKALLVLIFLSMLAVNTQWFLPTIKHSTHTPSTYKISQDLAELVGKTSGNYRVDGGDLLPPNISNIYKFQSMWGYSATIYAPYFEFTQSPRLDPDLVRDMLGVQLLATKNPKKSQQVVYKDPSTGISVIQRPMALPKMFTTDEPGSTSRADYHGLPVTTDLYKDVKQKYTVTLEKDAQVILSEMNYPGWQAMLDGKRVEVKSYEIDGTKPLIMLDIPAGTHMVEMNFKPFGIF